MRARGWLALLLAWLAALAPAGAAEERVALNFVNADIESVVKAVGEITGRNFVLDPRVKGVVNIVAVTPIPRSLVYPTLLSALRLQGFAAVESGGMVRIVPEADAKTNPTPVGTGPVEASGDRLVTQVYTLQHESAAQLVGILRPLVTPNNAIAAYPGNNSLIITDYAENLKRIERIIASLDQPPSGEPVLIALRHASALDVAQTLNRLLAEPAAGGAAGAGAAGEPSQRMTIVADPRTNSLLARSANPARVARVRQLAEQLDSPTSRTGNLHIVYLKNADATRVAQTLRAVLSGEVSPAGAPLSGATSTGPLPGGLGAAPLPAQGPSLAPASQGAGAGGLPGGITIQADAGNNALIINAPEALYNNLRTVIEMLDVRRAQVFVEALIVEMTAERAAELGIQWQVLDGVLRGDVQGFGSTNFTQRGTGSNIIDISADLSNVGRGLNLGIIKGTVSIPGIGLITNLALLARALETQANANILSTPNLLTLDNEEAKIVVGQNIPLVTGQYAVTGTATTPTPFQTIERRDIGLTLRVRPQITEGGTVRMAIYQEVSSVLEFTTQNGVVLNKRALESSVLVDDQSIVVLGGLIQDTLTDGTDKVPGIGDVPVVGQLFRYDTRKRTKTNLLVFLRPTVVREEATLRGIANDRYDYVIGAQKAGAPQERIFWPPEDKQPLPEMRPAPPPIPRPETPIWPRPTQPGIP